MKQSRVGGPLEEGEKLRMTFLLPRSLMERLRAQAARHRRSLVGELVWAIEGYLRREEGGADASDPDER